MNECGQGERNFGLGLDPQKRCNTPQIYIRTYSEECKGFKCRIGALACFEMKTCQLSKRQVDFPPRTNASK